MDVFRGKTGFIDGVPMMWNWGFPISGRNVNSCSGVVDKENWYRKTSEGEILNSKDPAICKVKFKRGQGGQLKYDPR